MRLPLLLAIALLATSALITPVRADERAPLPEALKTLLQEERFAKRAHIHKAHNRPDAWSLTILPGSTQLPAVCLDENEICRLIQALDGVKITELTYWADPAQLPLYGKLSGIEHLYLSAPRVDFDGVDAAMRELLPLLPELTELNIAHKLGNSGLEAIARHPKIHNLRISSPIFDDEGIRHLRNMRQLKSLGCRGSRITDAVFAAIAEISNLGWLDIGSQQITGTELGQLARLEKLLSLSLMDTAVTDESFRNLAGCTQLRRLTLTGTQFADQGAAALAPLKELRVLLLEKTPITDEAIAKLAELPNLEYLSLDSTNLTDAACTHLSKLPNLRYLYVNSTYVADPGVAALADCKILMGLGLENCGLTDRCVRDLCKLKFLTGLNVEQTDLTPAGVQALRDGLGECCHVHSGGTRDPNHQGLPKPVPVRTRRPM